ncbi:protein STPG4-like [Asterias amurensis]|uniref:protein STPG4-like n=1 Tax=Asterias amurensis TaxID=7602 RepID=UPI003AB36DF1
MVPDSTMGKTAVKPATVRPVKTRLKTTKDKTGVMERETKFKGRKSLKDNYEKPVSGRDQWWRAHIRETPIPGSYATRNFLADLDERPATYAFKGEGRKKDADTQRKGTVLLPGAYEAHDMVYDLEQTRYTYSMKNTSRDENELPGVKDKGCNVCPTQYPMENYLSLACEKQPSKHPMFKSTSQRFPTIYFQGTKNPPPDRYQAYIPETMHVISSSFKSRTPRFSTSHTKVPGPGSYDKTFQSPMPATISKMGRNHGLFFTSAFNL